VIGGLRGKKGWGLIAKRKPARLSSNQGERQGGVGNPLRCSGLKGKGVGSQKKKRVETGIKLGHRGAKRKDLGPLDKRPGERKKILKNMEEIILISEN